MIDTDKALRSLRLLRCEMVLTSVVIAMPVINIFYGVELGLDQTQIGLSQAAFTVAVLTLNVVAGWVADRFSRKACNVLGDLVVAGGFAYYSVVTTFGQVILAEVVIGVGAAFSQGADVALLRSYCQVLGRVYRGETSKVGAISPWFQAGSVLLGGLVGAWSLRGAVLLSALPYLVGAVLALGIADTGERHNRVRSSMSDVWRAISRPRLAWSIAAAAIASEITHAIIWVFSPLMLLAGAPVWLLGLGWAVNYAFMSLGSYIAGQRWAIAWPDWLTFVLPALLGLAAMVVLAVDVNLVLIWLYATFGLIRGWYSAVVAPIVQHRTPDDMQATVFSVAASLRQLLYVPLVLVINAAGNTTPQWSMAANAAIFAPLVVVVAVKLKKLNGG